MQRQQIFTTTLAYIADNFQSLKLNEDDGDHERKLNTIDLKEVFPDAAIELTDEELAGQLFRFLNAQGYTKKQLQQFMNFMKGLLGCFDVSMPSFSNHRSPTRATHTAVQIVINGRSFVQEQKVKSPILLK